MRVNSTVLSRLFKDARYGTDSQIQPITEMHFRVTLIYVQNVDLSRSTCAMWPTPIANEEII